MLLVIADHMVMIFGERDYGIRPTLFELSTNHPFIVVVISHYRLPKIPPDVSREVQSRVSLNLRGTKKLLIC